MTDDYTAELVRRLAKAEAERDAAQEHLAYHLRDYSLNGEATGDLAVDMARWAGRLQARLAKVEALADEWERLTDDGLLHYANRYVADLRAALASDPTHTQNGTQA